MTKRLIPLLFFCLFPISHVDISYAADAPSRHPNPAAKSVLEFTREEYQALLNRAMDENDYKFAMMKSELKSKIQYTLKRIDLANQTIRRQYEFLMERKLSAGK